MVYYKHIRSLSTTYKLATAITHPIMIRSSMTGTIEVHVKGQLHDIDKQYDLKIQQFLANYLS